MPSRSRQDYRGCTKQGQFASNENIEEEGKGTDVDNWSIQERSGESYCLIVGGDRRTRDKYDRDFSITGFCVCRSLEEELIEGVVRYHQCPIHPVMSR